MHEPRCNTVHTRAKFGPWHFLIVLYNTVESHLKLTVFILQQTIFTPSISIKAGLVYKIWFIDVHNIMFYSGEVVAKLYPCDCCESLEIQCRKPYETFIHRTLDAECYFLISSVQHHFCSLLHWIVFAEGEVAPEKRRKPQL